MKKKQKKKGPIELTEAKKLCASGCPHYIICMMPASLFSSFFLGVTRQSLFVGFFCVVGNIILPIYLKLNSP